MTAVLAASAAIGAAFIAVRTSGATPPEHGATTEVKEAADSALIPAPSAAAALGHSLGSAQNALEHATDAAHIPRRSFSLDSPLAGVSQGDLRFPPAKGQPRARAASNAFSDVVRETDDAWEERLEQLAALPF